MSEKAIPIALNAAEASSPTQPSCYPEKFAPQGMGRKKRRLGELFGLTKFGVNLTRLVLDAISVLRRAHSRQDEFVYI